MRVDGIEKEIISINPYRKSAVDIQLPQSVQKGNISKVIENIENFRKERTDNIDNIQKNYLSQEELNRMMEELRRKFSMLEKYLKINIDEELEIPISKIIDMTTEEIIRQIPPEWIVEILRRMEELKGLFYSEEV